jgi:predicted ATP-grasp superfamily ATP-dependent carboligase
VFAFEFFSGGGLAGRPLPEGLAREGDLMLRTLASELAEVPDLTVVVGRDPRLPPVPGCETLSPREGEPTLEFYRRGLTACDAAWPTAPESGGMLEQLARATLDARRTLLGCRPEGIALAASKRATAELLRERGVEVVPTYALPDPIPPLPGPWVVKPDDGAGCEDTIVVESSAVAAARLAADPARLVAQPWIPGDAVSLSLLCAHGAGRVLACNRQEIFVLDGHVSLRAIGVNAVRDDDGLLSRAAERIARAVPGLWGYVGVDLLLTDHGPVVLEINPRLTTSYAGLRRALGVNTAALVVGMAGYDALPASPGPRACRVVEIVLEPAHVAGDRGARARARCRGGGAWAGPPARGDDDGRDGGPLSHPGRRGGRPGRGHASAVPGPPVLRRERGLRGRRRSRRGRVAPGIGQLVRHRGARGGPPGRRAAGGHRQHDH